MAVSSEFELWRGSFWVTIYFLSVLLYATKCTASTSKMVYFLLELRLKTGNCPEDPTCNVDARLAVSLYACMVCTEDWILVKTELLLKGACEHAVLETLHTGANQITVRPSLCLTPVNNAGTPYINSMAKEQKLYLRLLGLVSLRYGLPFGDG